MEKYDFSGWATRNDLLCADGRTIRKDAFKHNDGQTVPLVWNHNHSDPENILGHALLQNRDEGVYAYCTFNESEAGLAAKEAVRHGDVRSLSIYANRLKQSGSDVLHGMIREVSIVMAGANPGAFIDSVMVHGEDTEEGFIAGYDENIIVHFYTEEDQPLQHADKTEEETKKESEDKTETKSENNKEDTNMADTKEKNTPEAETKEKTVKDVFDEFTEEQKTVVYALIGQALEDAGVADDENEEVEHSEGGRNDMYNNVFDRNEMEETNFLSHADQQDIINLAKTPGVGSLKAAMEIYANEHLQHGFETVGDNAISLLFPDYKDVHPGAPELLERDHEWVSTVMAKAHKSPVARVRTRQIDARANEIRAKGYKNRETEKAISGKVKLLMRTTDPQTIYYRDSLHRDDIVDITDFDVVAYQRNIMKNNLEEEIALAALVGDGRDDTHADKISEDHIRPVWHDDDLYTIKAPVDVAAMKTKLQGTNTAANFGDEFVYAEAIIAAVMKARIQYKGKGTPDFYCDPNMLNTMLLARDMNGRRIYDSAADLAKVLNVGNIFTIEQFADLADREDAEGNKFKLLGLIVNMANYQFGATKGGEITSFEDFDIDFNTYKYLMETRLSGALTEVYSAIALEEPVAAG
jgi:hypothetical protein